MRGTNTKPSTSVNNRYRELNRTIQSKCPIAKKEMVAELRSKMKTQYSRKNQKKLKLAMQPNPRYF